MESGENLIIDSILYIWEIFYNQIKMLRTCFRGKKKGQIKESVVSLESTERRNLICQGAGQLSTLANLPSGPTHVQVDAFPRRTRSSSPLHLVTNPSNGHAG